jgi:hypothetical protein
VRIRPAVVPVVLAAALAITACGSSRPSNQAGTSGGQAAPAQATSAPPPSLTCSTTLGDGETAKQTIAALVADQRSQDKSEEQNWVDVVEGTPTSQGQDLQSASNDFGAFSSSTTQLAFDAATFSTDASTFLSDQSGGLLPGWVSEYRAIQHDIEALADDCGLSYKLPAGE